MSRISALVVAHNEERQLAECLDLLAFADELVVVLDRCTDGSAEIARRHGAVLVEGEWEREGDRRNLGIERCAGPWVLEVDADERVGSALAAEIRQTVASSTHDWHEIPVDNYIGSRLVRWGWGASFGKSAYAGLFRKPAKRWGPQRVHPALTFVGSKGPRLQSRLDHYVDRNISDMLQRLDRYSTAKALDLVESGNIGTYGHNVRRIASRFWKCFVARRGYREGPYGFVIALCAGLFPILSYLKARFDVPAPRA